jgi:hypothetical protein
MPQTDVSANELMTMGANMLVLLNPRRYTYDQYLSAINDLIAAATKAGFESTLHVAIAMHEDVKAASVINYKQHWPVFLGRAHSLDSAIHGEGYRKTLILTDAKPPSAITDLTGLQPHQQAMLDDLVTCLKAHLGRPTIVMAWALGYDLVCSWIFNDPHRREAFATQMRQPLNFYHDFFGLNEYRVLDACRNSQNVSLATFTDSQLRDLLGLLDQRNDFTHANYNRASISEATAYVERVIRVVTGPPFA